MVTVLFFENWRRYSHYFSLMKRQQSRNVWGFFQHFLLLAYRHYTNYHQEYLAKLKALLLVHTLSPSSAQTLHKLSPRISRKAYGLITFTCVEGKQYIFKGHVESLNVFVLVSFNFLPQSKLAYLTFQFQIL